MSEAFNLSTRQHRFADSPKYNRAGERIKGGSKCLVCGRSKAHSNHIKIKTNRGRGNRVGDAHLSGR